MKPFERTLDTKLILSIVATGIMSFSGVVVETAMNVTFPALMEEFSVTTATVQWITTGYLLMLALVIPASSYLKRRFAMKALFLTAALLFLLGTVLAAAAPSFSWLLGGRLIQGVGTGLALPLMFNIVLEQAPLDKMGLMIGVASLITAVAPAVGPFAGGAIVEAFGWRMIFVVLLPLLFLSLVFGVTSIRQVSELVRMSFPWLEYLLLVCAFACFIFALTGASSAGWFSAHTLGLLAAAAVCAAAFYFHCKGTQAPLIRVQVFRCAPFTLSMLAIVCVQMICLGIGFLIPNYAQLVLHQNAFAAGCLLLPGCIVGAAVSPFSGRLLDRFGAKRPILIGNLAILFAAVCFGAFTLQLSAAMFLVIYLFFAFGQGCSMGNSMTNGLRQLSAELNADGNAVINTTQQLGGAVGTSIVSSIVAAAQAQLPGDVVTGTMLGSHAAFMMLAALAVMMLCCSLGAFYHTGKRGTVRSYCVQEKGSR